MQQYIVYFLVMCSVGYLLYKWKLLNFINKKNNKTAIKNGCCSGACKTCPVTFTSAKK